MPEHAVYVCSWSLSSSEYVLWVTSRPELRGVGSSLQEAEARLLDAIESAGGAIQSVLEFNPPLPKTALEAKYSYPELYLIGGDDLFETAAPRRRPFESADDRAARLQWADSFFAAPVCRVCGFSSSPRSARPLALSYAPKRYDGAFGSAGAEGANTLQIFSRKFIALLTAVERAQLDLRPVTGEGKQRFFELVGPAGLPFVAVSALQAQGWRCDACNYRTWGYWTDGLAINSFVARSDIPKPLTTVFTVGTPPDVCLAMTAARWGEIVSRSGTRGMISLLLGIAPDREVVRQPSLPVR